MSLKSKFVVLTVLLAVGTLALGTLTIRWYSSHFPGLSRAMPALVEAVRAGNDTSPYTGLKPSPTEPDGVYYKDKVLVLMYHDIAPVPGNDKTLALADFERQLQLMKENNFHWITMEQYRDFILHGAPVPDNAVLLTFDDGYESLYKYAYPVMKEHGAPAASFLIVNTVGNPKESLPKIDWDQVREMHNDGYGFYNHTFNSHRYAPTGPDNSDRMSLIARRIYLKNEQRLETEEEYAARVTEDLRQANEVLLRELGVPNFAFAFPYGAYSDALLDISRELGMDITFTVKSGLNGPGQTNGYRLNAGNADNDPVLQISLMKQAEKLLGKEKTDPALVRKSVFYGSAVLVLLVGLLWLRTGWLLFRNRNRQAVP
ncbi:polysaccharide deacetylase family protein [Paenibacillaceae bacterium WGS1546]|uniref:polysaccharide deacetylase family protein n=1 Tax=Cohnella sp. WGS1546 TaxID=3366810 RepID=UPI00372D4E27